MDSESHLVCNEGDTLAAANRNFETTQFDVAIGHIEDIIMGKWILIFEELLLN